jgi:hypothetical protein
MSDLPPREEVAPQVTEDEAFSKAERTYDRWISANAHPESKSIVAEMEGLLVRPATELLFAGLSVLSGQDFAQPKNRAVALACFAADHLLWGWFCAVIAQPRISLTLSRAAAEASIFAVHGVSSPEDFRKIWGSRGGTGGAVLQRFQGVPDELKQRLRMAWVMTAPFGHASPIPVMSGLTSFQDGESIGAGLPVAGDYAGPMDAAVLHNLANLYGLVSVVCVQSLSFCVADELKPYPRWARQYSDILARLKMQVPIPPELQPHIPRLNEQLRKLGLRE